MNESTIQVLSDYLKERKGQLLDRFVSEKNTFAERAAALGALQEINAIIDILEPQKP